MFGQIWKTLTRKKPLAQSAIDKSDLRRVLGLVDLMALGVASTLGMGVYIMAGSITKMAGPASALSFLIAGIAASLSALCYGEFAARVPKAGSAYAYSYVTVGEFIAFVVGWNLLLEQVIGTACVARALSGYIDSLFHSQISKYLSESLPMNYPYLSSYPDFFALLITIAFSILQAFGVVLSSNFNKIFTALNLTTICIVVLAGAYRASFHNWALTPAEIPHDKHGGDGGFLPYGFVSIFSAAAKCFYAYTGFDCVATTGEEAKNPQRNVPLALILTLLVAFFAYLGISVSLTLMVPYYDQNSVAPFPYAFDKANLGGVKWVVTVGALGALCACMVGSLYGTSRLIYSMAIDGLVFENLSYVHKKFQTPLLAIAAVGIFTGVVSVIFDVEMLVDMSSIGTLTAYTLVSICVLLLRYEPVDSIVEEHKTKVNINNPSITTGTLNGGTTAANVVGNNLFKTLFNLGYMSDNYKKSKAPTSSSSLVVKWMLLTMLVAMIAFCGCIAKGFHYVESFNPLILVVLIISFLLFLLSIASISRQPQSKEELTFKVRFVPLIPIVSTLMNTALMMMLNLQTWVRFLIWLVLGFIIYFGYGVRHSKENPANNEEFVSKMIARSHTKGQSLTIKVETKSI